MPERLLDAAFLAGCVSRYRKVRFDNRQAEKGGALLALGVTLDRLFDGYAASTMLVKHLSDGVNRLWMYLDAQLDPSHRGPLSTKRLFDFGEEAPVLVGIVAEFVAEFLE